MVELRKASTKAIKYACLHFHYAKRVPAVKYAYNVYQNGEWCGVICYGIGATPNISKPFGLLQGEVIELVRVALNGKQEWTSECVSASLRQIHKDHPQIKMIVSYADADQNHYGTIYQATNWIYLGRQNENTRGGFCINGKFVHPKSVHSRGWKQSIDWLREHIDPDAEEVQTKGKNKYIYCFDKKLRRKYAKTGKPYPKKEVDK